MPNIDIPENDARIQYTASAGQTTFIYDFILFDEDDVVVIQEGTELDLTTDYTVTGVGVETGGNIVLTSGATLGDLVTIYRRSAIRRDSQYQADGKFDAPPFERDFDKITTILQDQRRDIDRALTLDPEDTVTSIILPIAEANKLIAWNATADGFQNGPTVTQFETATTTAVTAAATATTQAGISTTQAGIATTQAGIATTKAAEAAASAASVDLPALGAAHTVLQSNASGDAAEYALIDINNLEADFINDATTGTIDSADLILFADVGSSNVTRKDTVANLLALAGGGAGWVPIVTKTAANDATIDFVNGSGGVVLDGTYKAYVLLASDVVMVDNGCALLMRTSTNGGSSYDSGSADYLRAGPGYVHSVSTANTSSSTGATSIALSGSDQLAGNSSGYGLSCIATLFNPAGTNRFRVHSSYVLQNGSGVFVSGVASGTRDTAADVDAFRLFATTGNISSGTFTLYGLASA